MVISARGETPSFRRQFPEPVRCRDAAIHEEVAAR